LFGKPVYQALTKMHNMDKLKFVIVPQMRRQGDSGRLTAKGRVYMEFPLIITPSPVSA